MGKPGNEGASKVDAHRSQIGVIGDGAHIEGGIHFHVSSSASPSSGVEHAVDFVIVTALEEELAAVLDKLSEHQRHKPSEEDIRVYYSAQLPVTFPDGSKGAYTLVVMPLLGMGRVEATAATGDAIRKWNPRYVVLVGIAGGVAGRGVQLGDVLVSSQIVDYELQKITPEDPEVRWQVYRADPRMVGAVRNFRGHSWQDLVAVDRPDDGAPTRHIGPIASGDKVIASSKVLQRYRDQWSKLIGVEMEAAGVAIAAHQAVSQPGVLMVRGVSDLADEEKGSPQVERWRAYACDIAAAYTVALLKSGPVVPRAEPSLTVPVQDENLRDKELAYLDGLLERYEYWCDHYTPLAGIAEVRAAVKDGPRLDLPMPFIPPGFEKLVEHGYGERVEVRREPVDDLRAAVAEHRRIVLLGDPGSGKTTTLWRMAYDYATAARKDAHAPLPLLVSLGGYTDASPFDAYLARHLGSLAPYLETYRASERLILLLDGLNEMPQADYAKRIDRIREVLGRQPDEMVVVTCRVLDYVVRLEELQKVEVSPLDEARIRAFLHNYLGGTAGERLFWALSRGDEVRDLWDTWQRAGGTWETFWTAEKMPGNVYGQTTTSQDELWERLRKESPPMLGLARNPYLLLMTAQVYAGEGGELPANRARLFAAFVDTLLGREKKRHPEGWIEAERQKDGLAALAYAMQAERGRGTTVEREWAVNRLCEAVPGCDAERGLYLATGASLLDAGDATVRFYHQLLQEYFAAREMGRRVAAGEELSRYWLPEQWWAPSGWEETAILLAGMEADASALLEKLAVVNPVVAARCLVEGGAQASEVARRSVYDALMARMVDEQTPPVARTHAGDALAKLGDPRPGVGLRPDGLPDIAWCGVPAGPFLMGTREEEIPALLEQFGGGRSWYEREVPQHKVILPAYRIGKYPVTNAQYAAFVAAGGYGERRYWTEAGWQWKGDRTGPDSYGGVFDLPNHPVVMVTWYEAIAFCCWLTARLRKAGRIEVDEKVTLPSEAEWEKAARGGLPPAAGGGDRGGAGRIFPWGGDADPNRANYADTGIGTTSAVGCFPGGASPYEVEDLIGNVWEWCRTKWQGSYEGYRDDNDLKGSDLRVLRGGAFNASEWDVRCAYRGMYAPDDMDYDIGFRVVVAPGFDSGL